MQPAAPHLHRLSLWFDPISPYAHLAFEHLPQALEGLSVVVLTYYLVGLIGYAAKALVALGVPAKAEVLTAAAILPAALLVFWGARRLKKRLMRKLESETVVIR